jgi:HEAT repeat protein
VLLFVAASFLLPAVHWRVIGWVKGEAFYDGRPTSYWSQAISNWLEDPMDVTSTPNWLDEWKQYLGWSTESSAVATLSENPDARPVLRQLSKDPNAQVRRTALGMLIAEKGQEAIPILIEGLKDEYSGVRLDAAFALLEYDADAHLAIPALVGGLKEESSDVRLEAVRALGRIGGRIPGSVHPLAAVLHDPVPEVRIETAYALGLMARKDDRSLQLLIDVLREKNDELRPHAALALMSAGDKARQAVPLLIDCWKTSDPASKGFYIAAKAGVK